MFKHKSIVVRVLSLELQLQQLLLQSASHLHRPALWLDVPTFAFIGSERDDLVTKANVFPTKVIQYLFSIRSIGEPDLWPASADHLAPYPTK